MMMGLSRPDHVAQALLFNSLKDYSLLIRVTGLRRLLLHQGVFLSKFPGVPRI